MASDKQQESFHRRAIEGNLGLFAVLATVAVLVGSVAEIVPMFSARIGPEHLEGVTPYTPLEVAGRDIYVREGCYTCHSQMVRPTRAELLRYGEWSRAGEYAYDRPFQLGSRRMGPDLHRVGGKYPDAWHYEHMLNPRSTTPGSVMPAYGWLVEDRIDPEDVRKSVLALRRVGTPYTDADVAEVPAQLERQGTQIVENLRQAKITATWDAEIVAMIAYLQRLGKDGRAAIQAREQARAGSAP